MDTDRALPGYYKPPLGKSSREAGDKPVNAGEHLKRAISESPPGLSGATDKTI